MLSSMSSEMGAGERHQAPILTCILSITYEKETLTIAKIFLDNFYCSYVHKLSVLKTLLNVNIVGVVAQNRLLSHV